MSKRFLSTLVTLGALICAPLAGAANLPYFTGVGGSNPIQFPADQYDLNNLISQINSGVTSQTTATYTNFRNILDNGAMLIQQRGTAATAGGAQSGVVSANYSADRWVVDTNVASGAGFSQVVTATPSPPLGFGASLKVYRNSGALLQPVCLIQEIATGGTVPLQGQSVVVSAYLQALAGLTAASNNVSISVVTGTGTDEGLKSAFTTAPAITPAWTGVATASTQTFSTTTAWARYQTTPILIPTTATEAAVEICFTPVGSSSGSTDGFAITGVQLEQSNTVASAYEFRESSAETSKAQRYFYQYADNQANTFRLPATCTENVSGTSALCTFPTPGTMRVAPTVVIATSNSFGMTKVADGTAEACTTLVLTASSATTNAWSALCSVSETAAVGTMHQFLYANSGAANTITVSADF